MLRVRRFPLSLSRFDRLVWATMVGLLLLAGFMALRGDRVGARVVDVFPVDGSRAVSTRAGLRVTFAQEMEAADVSVTVVPDVEAAVSWDGRALLVQPTAPLAPDTTYSVSVPAGLRSQRGQLLLRPLTWEFHTATPRLLYLGWDRSDVSQLFLVSPTGGEPEALTRGKENVVDYALSPDGTTVLYSVAAPGAASSDMWLVGTDGRGAGRLLRCDDGLCHRPTWSPDGKRLLYERRNIDATTQQTGPPRLWWLDVASGQTLPVFSDSQWLGLGATFSADGRWIGYVAPQSQEVQLYNLDSGETRLLPSETGQSPVWNPTTPTLVFTAYATTIEGFSVHLFYADLSDAAPVDLSGAAAVEDDGPVWSPDGAWIAFGRQQAGTTMGKQLWVMRADGREARALTVDPAAYYVLPAWSPDGRALAFQRYALAEANARPEIWVVDVAGGAPRQVVAAGQQPTWVP